MDDVGPTPDAPRSFVGLRLAAAVIVGVVYAGYMLALLAVGSCDAFGGTCDGSSPPILDDDVAGGAFIGTAAAASTLWWLRRPSLRQLGVGVGVALALAVVAAVLARGIAHG